MGGSYDLSGTMYVRTRVVDQQNNLLAFEGYFEAPRTFGLFRFNTAPTGSMLPPSTGSANFASAAGEYVGLITPPILDPNGSGQFRIKVYPGGTYIGRVILNLHPAAVIGSLDTEGAGSAVIARGTNTAWSLNLQLRSDRQLYAEVTDTIGPWGMGMGARRAGAFPPDVLGRYTVLLPLWGTTPDAPRGGFGYFRVNSKGAIQGRFLVPRVNPITVSHYYLRVNGWIDSEGGWSCAAGANGMRLLGRLLFVPDQYTDCSGSFVWDAPADRNAGARCDAWGARIRPYLPLINGLDSQAPILVEADTLYGNIDSQTVVQFQHLNGFYYAEDPSTGWKFWINETTGVVSGQRDTLNRFYRGVIYQPLGVAAGVAPEHGPTSPTFWGTTFIMTSQFTSN